MNGPNEHQNTASDERLSAAVRAIRSASDQAEGEWLMQNLVGERREGLREAVAAIRSASNQAEGEWLVRSFIEATARDEDDAEEDEEDEDMDEATMEDHLAEALRLFAEEQGEPEPRIRTFAHAGLLTGNHGLVVRIGGAEFQIQIVRSR